MDKEQVTMDTWLSVMCSTARCCGVSGKGEGGGGGGGGERVSGRAHPSCQLLLNGGVQGIPLP